MADDPHPEWRSETRAVRAGRTYSEDSLAPVLWPSTTYFDRSVDEQYRRARAPHPGKFYSRNGSPSVLEFEDAVAALEGAEAALAFASGMGAISSVLLTFCGTGDHVVAQTSTFSVTSQLFTMLCPRLGIDVTFVDATDSDAVRAAVRPGKTQIVFVESPANPGLDVVDLDAVGSIAGPYTVCDSTFAPPPVQQTLSHGIDLVMHAATKGLAGHNDAMLGVIAGDRDLVEAVWGHHLMHGAVCSPFDAWNALRGIRTLHVRVARQSETALAMAEFLEGHAAVARVSYPGLESHPQREVAKRQMTTGGGVLTFELAGGLDAGRAFVEAVELAQVAPSLGGPETLVVHPPTMTAATLTPDERASMGIGEGMIRVSIGLEHVDDLIADFAQALDRAVTFAFTIADVFTDTPLTGNQLAVFCDASSIDEQLLQSIAREIGFSETVFVYPGDRVRIFTPAVELPFAGHPILGTAFVLASARGSSEITLHPAQGAVPVSFDEHRRGTMRQPLPDVSAWHGDETELYAALGISGSRLPVECYVNGPRHVIVLLASPADVAALRPDFARLAAAAPGSGVSCVAGEGLRWKTRMFGPAVGVDEDPATGSAAGPLVVHLCRHGLVPWGTEITISQGAELQRPSTLYARAAGGDDRVEAVEVSGHTVVVGSGDLDLTGGAK